MEFFFNRLKETKFDHNRDIRSLKISNLLTNFTATKNFLYKKHVSLFEP